MRVSVGSKWGSGICLENGCTSRASVILSPSCLALLTCICLFAALSTDVLTNAHIIRPSLVVASGTSQHADAPPDLKPFVRIHVRGETSIALARDTSAAAGVAAAAAAATAAAPEQHTLLGAEADLVFVAPEPLDVALLRVRKPAALNAVPAVSSAGCASVPLSVGMRVFVAGYPLFGAAAGMYLL